MQQDLESLIDVLREIHGNKYEYIELINKPPHRFVRLVCDEHGEFTQRLSSHVSGSGCRSCGLKKRWDTRRELYSDDMFGDFVRKAKKVHDDFYKYDKKSFLDRNGTNKVKICCPDHGEFFQNPGMHVAGNGCPECARLKNPGRYCYSYFEKNPNERERPSILYFVRFEEFYKIGITINTVAERFKGSGPYEVMCEVKTNLFDAFSVEQMVLEKYKKWGYGGNLRITSRGNTERFSIEAPYCEIIEYIEENII